MMKRSLIGLGIALAVLAGCSLSLIAGAMAGSIGGYLGGRQATRLLMPRLWQGFVPPRGPWSEQPEPQVQPPEPWELSPGEMPRPLGWELNAALITEVEPGDPADEAGVEAGDVIIGVDNRAMHQRDDLSELVRRHAPGDDIVLNLLRRGEETQIIEIEVTLGRGRDEQGEMTPRLGVVYQPVRVMMGSMTGDRGLWDWPFGQP